MYDYLDLRQTERLKELVPYKVLAPDADEIIKELDRLNNIITELEKWLEERTYGMNEIHTYKIGALEDEIILNKLKELKENK